MSASTSKNRKRSLKSIETQTDDNIGKENKAVNHIVEEGDKCCICLADDVQEPCHSDVCRHICCFLCLKEWFKQNISCPLCRTVPKEMLTIYSESGKKRILLLADLIKELPPKIKVSSGINSFIELPLNDIIREIERNLDNAIALRTQWANSNTLAPTASTVHLEAEELTFLDMEPNDIGFILAPELMNDDTIANVVDELIAARPETDSDSNIIMEAVDFMLETV